MKYESVLLDREQHLDLSFQFTEWQTKETGIILWVFLWSGYFMFDRWITSEITYLFMHYLLFYLLSILTTYCTCMCRALAYTVNIYPSVGIYLTIWQWVKSPH